MYMQYYSYHEAFKRTKSNTSTTLLYTTQLTINYKVCNEECSFWRQVTDLFIHYCSRLSFKFLKPSLSEVSVIYTLPFSRSVWVTYTITVIILSVALYATERLQRWMNPSQTDPPLLFCDTALNSLAIMCAEGKTL